MKIILHFLIIISLCSCSSINNSVSKGCDWKITFLNTGLNLDGSANLNLIATGQKDPKWIYCKQDYPPTLNFTCSNAVESLVSNSSFTSLNIINNAQMSVNLPAAFPNSSWIVADLGQMVHSMPYYHIFNTTFCLDQSELNSAANINISIQAIDAPLEIIYINNSIIWNYTTGPMIFSIPNLIIPKTFFQSGINSLRIVTFKKIDNNIQSQYSALNVIGYLRTIQCCN